MDDALVVCGRQGAAEHIANRQDPFDVQPTRRNEAIERLPLDQFHRQEREAVGLLDRVNRDDGGMIDRGDGAGLALEALDHLRARSEFGG